MTPRTIEATEFRKRFQVILEEIQEGRTVYVVARQGRPVGVVLSYEEYEYLQQASEQQLLADVDEMIERMATANAAFTDAEVAEDVSAARRELAG